jgi:hypothetical protein
VLRRSLSFDSSRARTQAKDRDARWESLMELSSQSTTQTKAAHVNPFEGMCVCFKVPSAVPF